MKPEEILNAYPIRDVKKITPISVGLIHQTFKVETSSGNFILQRLHDVFSKEMTQNVSTVGEYLEKHGMEAQRVVLVNNGEYIYETTDGNWRLLTYIPGKVFETVPNTAVAFEAGKILGRFHRVLFHAPLNFVSQRANGPTDYLKKFQQALAKNEVPENMKSLAKTIEKIFSIHIPENLQKGILQGDPKITNIIFDQAGVHAKVMIDIDDVGEGILLNDLTDAARSWCSDKEDAESNTFSLEKFKAMLQGYNEGSENLLPQNNLDVLPRMTQQRSLTLAARFFVDWFEDSYFSFDASRFATRKEHNFARTRGQVALYEDLVKKEKQMSQVITSIFGSVD